MTISAKTCKKTFKIKNELGLHARAAAKFVKISNRYESDITIQKEKQQVNGKSIMGILTLAASKGTKIDVITKGKDAQQALEDLTNLIEGHFEEK